MASFPSRHIRAIFGSGLGRRRRGQRLSSASVSALAAERLEQRATMAADCCPDWVDWSVALSGDQEESWPAYGAEDCSTVPPGYAPPTDPESSPFATEEDSWDTAAYRDMMAALAAEAQAEQERQAAEEARREAAMIAEMAAYFANQALPEFAGVGDVSNAWSDTDCGSGSAPGSPVIEDGADASGCFAASPPSVDDDACGDVTYTGPNESRPTAVESFDEETMVVASAPVIEDTVTEVGSMAEIDYVYDWEADERQRQADEERERLVYEASEREIAAAIALEGQMVQGRDSSVAGPFAGPTADESITADAWPAFGQSSLTVSGVTPQQDPLEDIPTLSLSGTERTPMPSPTTPAGAPLITTVSGIAGSVYDPSTRRATEPEVEASRWTAMDRVARLAAEAAYSVDDGGILGEFVRGYGPSGTIGKYGTSGFSATLSRVSDYLPNGADNEYILAFRGTTSLTDWWANTAQVFGFRTSQFDQAIRLTSDLLQHLPEGTSLLTTGHSKGGAQAVAASFATGVPAIVFNPSSLSRVYQEGAPRQITTHITFGDPLSVARTLQNILESLDPEPLQEMRSAAGEVIVHPPASPWTHSMANFPD